MADEGQVWARGSRLTDEKCDPAARRCRLRSGEAKSRFQRETLNVELRTCERLHNFLACIKQ